MLLAAGTASAAFADAAAPPPEAFGTLPVQTNAVLSRDGQWLAWVDHREAKPRVVIFDVLARKPQRILAVPERVKLRHLVWSDNETLLIVLSETTESKVATEVSREYFRTIAHDVSGGSGRMLPINNGGASSVGKQTGTTIIARSGKPALANLIAAHTTKPKTVIMSTYGACNAVIANCLLEVDTRTGIGTVIKVGNEFTTMWVVDRDGRPVAREDWDWHKHAYRLYALAGERVREILRKDDSEHPTLTGLLADGSALVLLATNGRRYQAAWALPLDGSPARLLAEDPDADITNTYTDVYTGTIIGVYVSGTKTTVQWLDPSAQHRQDVLQRAFAGRQVEVYGWTADGAKCLARVETPSSPPVYYLVDFTTHRADIAAEEYPALAGVPLGEVKEITYKARDGTAIPAYLTAPSGKSTVPVPLVVLPHGGPNARDYPTFDWLAQFLASRGYAVLQPEFRGSIGFGDAFREAGYRQWGGLMQDDVTDGVHSMIEQGIADPHRICIVGASYGGYAALAGAAFTPGLYACAVSINGVTDLPALMREEVPIYSGTLSTSLSVWKARIGAPNDPNLSSRSPINAVKSITTPILIVYGTGDGVVPTEQSERMARALSAAGKPVALVTLPGEDHWLSRTDTRVQVLRELDSFLKLHL
jgi:dipeptidyl aminopeptidase/acylaminoacyl peptidase